jgi:hypothetical protein
MDRGRLWIATGLRWMSGGGCHEMDHERGMTINLLSYGSYKVIIGLRFADIQCSDGIAPPSTMLSTHHSTTQSTIQRY